MTFEGDGYLSEESAALIQPSLEGHTKILDMISVLLGEIRNFCQVQRIDGQQTSADKQKIVALILFSRITEISEAALLVMRHGMANETNSLLRIFLDAYFILGNVCSDEDFVPQFFKSDEATRLKLMNVALNRDSDLFRELREYAHRERDKLSEKIKQEDIQAFQSYTYAANLGAQDIYDSMYRLTSSSIHTGPRSLEAYTEEDEEGNIVKVKNHPRLGDIPQLAYTFCTLLVKVYSGITEVFGKHDPEKVEQLARDLEACVENA